MVVLIYSEATTLHGPPLPPPGITVIVTVTVMVTMNLT